MRNDIRGFSLTELMITIVIMSILLGIASLSFNTWQKKYAIENQAKEIMTGLSDLRMRAIHTKSNHVAVLSASPTTIAFRSYSAGEPVTLTTGRQISSKTLNYPISNNATSAVACGDIVINSRGYTFDNQTIYILPTNSGAAVDCLVISETRINLGRYNGTDCSFQ